MEIGYGLGLKYEHKRIYMTEERSEPCRWALEQEEVRAVIAEETEPDGLASIRVLGRCGFKKWKTEGKFGWWRLDG